MGENIRSERFNKVTLHQLEVGAICPVYLSEVANQAEAARREHLLKLMKRHDVRNGLDQAALRAGDKNLSGKR